MSQQPQRHLHLVPPASEQVSLPEPAQAPAFFLQQAARLQRAMTALQASITDLERDWSTRDPVFWQEILTQVKEVREVPRALESWMQTCDKNRTLPMPLRLIRYQFLIQLDGLTAQVEQVGLLLAAYLPLCRRPRVEYLRHRQQIVQELHGLSRRMQQTIDLLHREEAQG